MPKTVQLSDEAYATLAALKAPGESFSEAVLRIVGERKDPTLLLNLGGLRPGYDYRELRLRSLEIENRRLKARADRKE